MSVDGPLWKEIHDLVCSGAYETLRTFVRFDPIVTKLLSPESGKIWARGGRAYSLSAGGCYTMGFYDPEEQN
jgi:hypothetical protein